MTTANLPSGQYLLIDVQEGFFKHEIIKDSADEYRLKTSDRVGDNVYSDSLPEGQWELIGKGDGVTEEIAAGIVGKFINGEGEPYYYYPTSERFATALASFNSWIRSHGKEPKQIVVVKKIKQ